ncbi:MULTISPECIES: carboxylate-amine ligase [Nocardioides]|uniref:Putative glutamate--cysteine ligase 2 n=1 Tax=Nocardioides vastitatis TaxID=2568655 RepID=A0ABW0ZIN6_9ACTN|nr:glutamate--cysteine ligase [Nocardioides sp.]THJ14775.1 YbdK family carboxylate-amine ligase [Nocardioides sp.]
MARTVGVEEELLVVDKESGRPRSVAGRVIRQAGVPAPVRGSDAEDEPGGRLGSEFKQEQVETDTSPRASMADLETDLRQWRDIAVVAARKVGARVVATGTSPAAVTPHLVRDERYERMSERYGITATEHLTCGCHVHVAVESDDEGVIALNRMRVWLPALLALSANSPYWNGKDTGYASFRSQAMARWPSAGPTELFASGEHYWSSVARMVATGVILDEGMVYFDARLSARYPTVEIRVADVCLDVRDAVLIASLCRGLVDTAVSDDAAGVPVPEVSTAMLRLAMWQASRDGVDGELLDPATCRPRPGREVVARLYEHVRPALEATSDAHAVQMRLAEVMATGNGARQQRQVLRRTHQIGDVVAHLARVTAGQLE